MRFCLLVAGFAAAMLVSAPVALGAAALGRVVYPMADSEDDDGATEVEAALATADGGVITAGYAHRGHPVVLIRLRRDGKPDRSFGTDGMVSLPIQGEVRSRVLPGGLLDTAGGSFYVVNREPGENGTSMPPRVTRVLSDGSVDRTYGAGGAVVGGIEELWPGRAAVQPDGSVVVTGSVRLPGTSEYGGAVERFTPAGAPDPTFGAGGVVVLPVGLASEVAVLQDGSIAVASGARLVVLRADGSPDPSFNGSGMRDLGERSIGGIVARPEGGMDILVHGEKGAWGEVLRLRRDGSLDPAFGAAGAVRVLAGLDALKNYGELRLVPAPGNAELVSATNGEGAFRPTMRVVRLLPDGSADPRWNGADGRVLQLPFGGSYLWAGWPVAGDDPLKRNALTSAIPVARAGGGLLVTASVETWRTGGGPVSVHRELGVAAYKGDLTPDPAWGSRTSKLRLTVWLPRVTARGVARWHGFWIGTKARALGIARIQMLVRGRVVARSVNLAGGPRPGRDFVMLTEHGERTIGYDAGARLTVRIDFRDMLGDTVHVTRYVRLR